MGRRRGQDADRESLTPGAIAERAIALAGEEGLHAVTIRRLTTELGVTPMALYWHFRNKDELLDAMAASLLAGTDLSVEADAPWPRQLRAVLSSLADTLRSHPGVASLVTTRTVATEASLRATERLLDILRRAGFPAVEATLVARLALATVVNLVAGETGVVVQDDAEPAGSRDRARLALASLPAAEFPRLVEAAGPLSEGVDRDAYVAFGLDLFLAGVEAMAARHR